ncbi:hypothetical protein BDZ94DRAFT_1180243 [Collybia nuda]|uniref:Uncharacterized protein n=1 Tax=Collybia nuda TaxID=64659 RepID=A0A9P5XR21_9AGAR|nr:hypothetical protein BDZ94DRAFT_1180243 [Collybia nuda]
MNITDFWNFDIISCGCQGLLHVLVTNGLFPSTPTAPQMAVSILLLEFYTALFEQSCDAIHALARAL